MKSIDRRLAELEHQPGPATAYVVYSDAGDYVMVDGERLSLDLFGLRYPRVAIASLKSYQATVEWNPEDV